MEPRKTTYFKNALGVFQGGGCKALALVGAYKEAHKRGVFFSEVAGSSAGAVVAALIAAGAKPEDLEEIINKTDFSLFKRKADRSNLSFGTKLKIGLISKISRRYSNYGEFLENFGNYSSEYIEEWLEEKLRALLQYKGTEKIKFEDLRLPLSVLATDIQLNKPKVWSMSSSPGQSVAYAVRCSCTIPVFFQPVDGSYVDGGIVSNLPSYLLENNDGDFEKVLCFALGETIATPNAAKGENNVEQYLKQLSATIIDSAVHIQNELQPTIYSIVINNLPLDTVDFEQINAKSVVSMYKCGQVATADFFENESAHIKNGSDKRLLLKSEPTSLNHIVREVCNKGDVVVISLRTTRYVYNLFPTLLKWILNNVEITFVTISRDLIIEDVEHEKFRRNILQKMGVKLIEANALPLECFYKKSADSELGNVLVFAENRTNSNNTLFFSSKYISVIDEKVISLINSEIEKLIKQQSQKVFHSSSEVLIRRGPIQVVIERLKTINEYSGRNVLISHKEISTDDLLFLTRYVSSYKYSQVRSLTELYQDRGFELFESLEVVYKLGEKEVSMPITPPVVERIADKYYVIEGNSRLTYLTRELKVKKVKLIVVEHVSAPLPTSGSFISDEVVISDIKKMGNTRYKNFEYPSYRYIERAVRKPSLYEGM